MRQLIFVLFVCSFCFTNAQDSGVISGKILDAELYNEPLLMANVALKHTEWSTQTNFNGNFELPDVPAGDYVLQIDFLGYERLEVAVHVNSGEQTAVLESLNAKAVPMFDTTAETKKEEDVLIVSANPSLH